MLRKQLLKVENSLLELEKDFIQLKDKELKDREVKIKREVDKLFFKPIVVSTNDINKFEQKWINEISPFKNDWYDWLINYIPDPIIKSVAGFKDKIVSLFKTNTPKKIVYGRGNSFILKKIKNKLKIS